MRVGYAGRCGCKENHPEEDTGCLWSCALGSDLRQTAVAHAGGAQKEANHECGCDGDSVTMSYQLLEPWC